MIGTVFACSGLSMIAALISKIVCHTLGLKLGSCFPIDKQYTDRQIDESNGRPSVVIQVDSQCRFEHVAKILSLFEEAGVESPRLTTPYQGPNAF